MGGTITVSDPIQAAELRSARQTVLGFMWGLVLVTFVVVLCGGLTNGLVLELVCHRMLL